MSEKQNVKKLNIIKRLSIPSISEIKFKESLLNELKKDEPEIPLNKGKIKVNFRKHNSMAQIDTQKYERKEKKSIHLLELKIEELENTLKLKDEEIVSINKALEDEKIKLKKLFDIIAKKELKIDSLKKCIEKYEKQSKEKVGKNNESTSNKLIKIDIINKKVEYNLNLENNHLKEELKLIKDENLKLKEQLEKNKEIIINLKKSIDEKNNENKKLEGINSVNDKKINSMKEEIKNLKETNEKYINNIKEKENIIYELKKEINYYITDKEESENEINKINNIHKILQNELEDVKKSIKEKENYNNDIINNLEEEAIEAKVKYADTYYQNDIKYMKLKKQFDKLISTLDSLGIKVKEIK